ncbi:FtsX-like permease family protein [Nocardiopsis tropica]|uniref:FtsX-like permease family protein n=1 Tax=Nocardiopsis tropica TaxID=109330 RepID=A0ABU7KX99_9ACTN|nr:FtsX-like permease family protein [Nocardiopsis umidischolae]MEE2053899.1 FtsX-like permease family protein [Nocardiopsis umidischolae]
MIGIAWRMLSRQVGTMVGAIVMITVGAALLTSFVIVQDSISRARAPVERYAAADIVAAGEPGVFPAAAVDGVASVPGVAEVVPELSFPVTALNGDGSPVVEQNETAQFGHGWTSARLAPFTVTEGEEPASPEEVVLDQGLAESAEAAVGDRIGVDVAGARHAFQVVGVARNDGADAVHQHALFFSPGTAAELAERGEGRVDGIGVFLEAGADPVAVGASVQDGLTSALAADVSSPSGAPSFRVEWGEGRGELEGAMPDHRASAQTMTMLVWIVAFMAVAVVGGALVTSVRRRAGQFALLRAVGATPRQVRGLCQAEALLMSVLAVIVGGALGVLLAWALLGLFRALGVVSPVLTLSYGPSPFVLSAVIVVAVGQVAAWMSSRSALRIPPGDAMAGQATTPGRKRGALAKNVAGVLLLGGAGALQAAGMAGSVPAVLQGSYGMFASGLIIVGVALLGSSVIHVIARAARHPVAALSGVGGYLASANVRFHYRRYAGVAAPLAVGVAIAGWALSGLPLFALANADDVMARFDSGYVLHTPIVRDSHTGLSEQVREDVAQVAGVEATVGLRETWLSIAPSGGEETDSSLTRGTVAAGDAGRLLDLGEVEGSLEAVDAGEGVALGSTYAARNGIGLGDEVRVRLTGASEATTLPVRALFSDDRAGQEAAVVSRTALEGRVGEQWHDYVLVAADASTGVPDLREAADGASAMVEGREQFQSSYVESRRNAIDNLGTIATALVGVFLVVAAVNALALSAADRRSELSSVRRLSATPFQINVMVGWEMVLTVVPAWLLGAGATLWMALAMAGGDVDATLWAFPSTVLLLIGAFGLVLAVAGGLTATRSVLKAVTR